MLLLYRGPTTPTQCRFGLFPFRSPLLRESLFVFFSSGYLDVSVLRVPLSYPMCSDKDDIALLMPGSPFGYLRIFVCLQLPVAFRRLLRPSSVSSAKASTVRPYLLNHVFVFLLSVCLEFCLFNLLLMNSLLQLTL